VDRVKSTLTRVLVPRPVRKLGRDIFGEVRRLPIAADPVVSGFFRRKINIAFFAIALLIMFPVTWATMGQTHDVMMPLRPLIAVIVAFPIVLAWANPLLGWGISVIGALGMWLAFDPVGEYQFGIQVPHIIELMVLTALAVLRAPLAMVPAVWIGSALTMTAVAPNAARGGWFAGMTVLVVFAVLLRAVVRSRSDLAKEAERTEAVSSENAILAERARIARDLHDVVAHKMSVVVVQSQTARYRIADVSDGAAAEFETIATVAREALDEVRAMLGVLRPTYGPDGAVADAPRTAPSPGLDDIGAVVASTQGAGVAVDYRHTVELASVSEATGLVAYRIVQESLANATRHAPGASVTVTLDRIGDMVHLAIANTAATGAVEVLETVGGHGITGMTERAHAVGGQLSAGAVDGGGFRVTAILPARPQQP